MASLSRCDDTLLCNTQKESQQVRISYIYDACGHQCFAASEETALCNSSTRPKTNVSLSPGDLFPSFRALLMAVKRVLGHPGCTAILRKYCQVSVLFKQVLLRGSVQHDPQF